MHDRVPTISGSSLAFMPNMFLWNQNVTRKHLVETGMRLQNSYRLTWKAVTTFCSDLSRLCVLGYFYQIPLKSRESCENFPCINLQVY